jgi:DNA-binding NarL/FixJ family response regulator
VFVLDDHELVRAGLRSLLRSAGIRVVGESGSAREAGRRIPALAPALAVLDDRLPDGTGIEVCRAVAAVDPRIRCVVMTDGEDEAALVGVVLAGAWGCLSRRDDGSQTLRLVRRVLDGRTAFSPVFRAMLLRSPPLPQGREPRLPSLAPQELRVLLLIGEGLSTAEIATVAFLAPKTVKNITSNLMQRLGVGNRTQAALLVAGELARAAAAGPAFRFGGPAEDADRVRSALLECVSETEEAPGPGPGRERARRLALALDDLSGSGPQGLR